MQRVVRLGSVLLLAGAMWLGGGDTVARAAGPDPASVYVDSLSYSGTGCPQGSVGISLADDRLSFTVIFDSFVASTGPNVPASESRKACDVSLSLKAPSGWSFAIVHADTRGYVQLPAGLKASSRLRYDFDGDESDSHHPTDFSSTFTGPVSKDYLLRDETPPLKINWSKCGGVNTLKLRSSISVDRSSALTAQATIDSIDGKITKPGTIQGYSLTWRQCASGGDDHGDHDGQGGHGGHEGDD